MLYTILTYLLLFSALISGIVFAAIIFILTVPALIILSIAGFFADIFEWIEYKINGILK